jgi:hypothetical protein
VDHTRRNKSKRRGQLLCSGPAPFTVTLLLLIHLLLLAHVLTPRQFVIVRTKLESVQGRKVKVSGTMETLDGEVVADAT